MDTEGIQITVKKSAKARHMRITVKSDGTVVATQPVRANSERFYAFVKSKLGWVQKVLERMKGRRAKPAALQIRHTKKEYVILRKKAKILATERLEYFNQFYNFKYNKVFIKNQKTRWGSCSGKGNLNFNYKILFLAPRLCDYLIVHELCHLREMNHGPKFWELVAQQIPDYKRCSKELRLGNLE